MVSGLKFSAIRENYQDLMEKEEEPRYVHLLQPNRDLAANWAVDVAWELESYLAGLSLISTTDDEGHTSCNFAEAALLIQGSIQIYSRKVEYLYALVLQALDFIAHKKQAQQENTSIQANGKDADIVEDQEEDFLNLDDVPEEANIDIVDEENGSCSITPAVKRPACLLVVEGDNFDISGDAGELASYQISTSSLHRDFLLLDPCDAKFVDEYWKANERGKAKGTPHHPPNSASRQTPRGSAATPNHKHNLGQDAGVPGTFQRNCSVQGSPGLADVPTFDDGVDDWHDENGGGETWGEELNDRGGKDNINATVQEEADVRGAHNLSRDNEGDDQEDIMDPWAPLNPHEPGTLPVVPYKRGRPSRRRVKKTRESVLEPVVSGLGKVWQTLECLEREAWRAKQSEEPPPYEKLRGSFIAKGSSVINADWSSDKSDKGSDSEESGSDDGRFEGADEPADVYEPDFVEDYGSQDPSQQNRHDMEHNILNMAEKGVGEGSCLEDLCQAHLGAILKKHAEPEVRTEIANRVTSWKQKIEKNLAIQDAHPPFDIHAYGERVLEKLSPCHDDEMDASDVEKPFTHIVAGLEKHEIARTFAALLQLVNNGNVSLEKGSSVSSSECFTAEKPFFVKLLSCRRRHDEMLHYRAPSSRPVKSSARKKGKGVLLQASVLEVEGENVMGGFGSGGQAIFSATPPSLFLSSGKSKRMSGGIGRLDVEREVVGDINKNLISPNSTTPEGKRRRRRQSLKSVQVRLAG